MTTHTLHTITHTDRELTRFAAALTDFASSDTVFADWLQAAIIERKLQASHQLSPIVLPGRQYVRPQSAAHASTIATWVLDQCQASPVRYKSTLQFLLQWESNQSAPKNQIFGIIGIAIIGPTLGLIKTRKRKKSQLRIVLPTEVYRNISKAAISSLVQTISGQTIAQELQRARGRVSALHPDTAEWLMCEHATVLYTTSLTTMTDLKQVLTTNDLPHSAYAITNLEAALALSPSLSDEILEEFTLTIVE